MTSKNYINCQERKKKMQNRQINGLAEISPTKWIPYCFLNDTLTLLLGGEATTLSEGTQFLLGQKTGMLTGGGTLYHSSAPIENFGHIETKCENGEIKQVPTSIGNVNIAVDYYIDDYCERSEYSEMRFSFAELNYFIPSAKACTYSENSMMFSQMPIELCKFEFGYRSTRVSMTLRIYSAVTAGLKCTAETKSELQLQFTKTDNIDYLVGLYHVVRDIFTFLCNRQNISFDRATIMGEKIVHHPAHSNGKTMVEEKKVPTSQTLVVIDRYVENPESDNVASKTVRYDMVSSHFEQLFQLILDDKVSLSSIHASVKAKNYFDLKQCLHITAAFEHYERLFLPEIPSPTTLEVYEEVKKIIGEYADAQTGRKKKKAESLLHGLAPMLSLKDKIIKIYTGYSTWPALSGILDEWFLGKVDDLADVANKWRNELAHEKRTYEPDERVVSAIRLVEHINYCIVLRQAGYVDEEIKAFLEYVLTH